MKAIASLSLMILLPLAAAAADSRQVTIPEPIVVAGTELKAGEYNFDVDNGMLTIKKGKRVVQQAPARLDKADAAYKNTSLKLSRDNGKFNLQEVRLGGTNTKITLTGTELAKTGQVSGVQ